MGLMGPMKLMGRKRDANGRAQNISLMSHIKPVAPAGLAKADPIRCISHNPRVA
jgi:hypothetical protein